MPQKNAKYLLLFLLFLPSLACFDISVSPLDVQGERPMEITIKNTAETNIIFDMVEVHFSEPQNITNLVSATCGEKVGEKCKMLYWKFNKASVAKDEELVLFSMINYCASEGEEIQARVVVTGGCPIPIYDRRMYFDTFTAHNNLVCGEQHSLDAQLQNVSIWAYYRTFGGNGTLYISVPSGKENITDFDPKCEKIACGKFEWREKAPLKTLPFSFQVCGNTTDSEITVGEGGESVIAWWKYYNYTKTVKEELKTLKVYGIPKINIITFYPVDVKERESLEVRVSVSSTCGRSAPMNVSIIPYNETAKDPYNQTTHLGVFLTSSSWFNVDMDNGKSDWVTFYTKTNNSGEIKFNASTSYLNYTNSFLSEKLKIIFDPNKCDWFYQRCSGVCRPEPNCTMPCSLGIICENGQLECKVRKCGTACPNNPDQVCDFYGYCLFRQELNNPCDCTDMCKESYLSSGVCYSNPICRRVCVYTTKSCANGVCTQYGCCGDGVCDTGEDCLNCEADCGCSKENQCVKGTCSRGVCIYESASCGVTCSEGVCDGLGNCRKDACCDNSYCENKNECTTGICSDFTCQYSPLTCTNCTGGFCLDGICTQFQSFDKKCECDNACGTDLVCRGGKCSKCGNKKCDDGECLSCITDCDIKGCGIRLKNSKVLPGLIILIVFIIGLRMMMPSILEFEKKLRPPPPSEGY